MIGIILLLLVVGAVLYFTVPGFKEKIGAVWAAVYAAGSVAFAAIIEYWEQFSSMWQG